MGQLGTDTGYIVNPFAKCGEPAVLLAPNPGLTYGIWLHLLYIYIHGYSHAKISLYVYPSSRGVPPQNAGNSRIFRERRFTHKRSIRSVSTFDPSSLITYKTVSSAHTYPVPALSVGVLVNRQCHENLTILLKA